MRRRLIPAASGLVCAWMLAAGTVMACDPVEDGCLGCSDETLGACIDGIVTEICNTGRTDEFCDRRSATDDVEELVLKNMGRHMSRVRALVRSGARYKHTRPSYR